MVWSPDHIWEALKVIKALKGEKGGAKGGVKKTTPVTKNQWGGKGGGQDLQQMLQALITNPNKQQAVKAMAGAASGLQTAGVGDAKMFLHKFVFEKTGSSPSKDQIVYTTAEVEDSKPRQYISEVTLLEINPNKSYKGQPSPNKKAAEASAAEAALRQNGKASLLKVPAVANQPTATQMPNADNPKNKLAAALPLLIGKPNVSKEDLVYSTEGAEGGGFISIVLIPGFSEQVIKGLKQSSIKLAEASAAEKALQAFSKEIKVAKKAHDARKLEKNKVAKALWREKQAAKKIAAAAEPN